MIVPGLDGHFLDPLDLTPLHKVVKVSSLAKKIEIYSMLKWSFINLYLKDDFCFFRCLVIFPQIEF